MTLDKAIEILTTLAEPESLIDTEMLHKAIKLGIEATKWRKLLEEDYGSWCGPPLPGETND